MASLTLRSPHGPSRTLPLVKRLTSIGRGADNDIQLDDPNAPDSALSIMVNGLVHQANGFGSPFLVNGEQAQQHRLAEGDVLRVGDTELSFSLHASAQAAPSAAAPSVPAPSVAAEVPSRELAASRRLAAFSEALLQSHDLDRLLERLMDEVIDVSRADKGFLILMDNNELRVKVARNIARENIEDAVERVSDSIIAKVVKGQKALILSDVLDDPEFKSSESVVNLKLLSVMCVPLMHKGELFGVIYLGNDRLVNRFEPRSLELVTVFASQASLLLQNAMLVNELRVDNTELRKRLEDQRYGDIVGACQGIREVYKRIDKIAATDIGVLITGETGTGKELIAREIHRRSPRNKGPFITINCGAIPENLLESELFGHVKGAFTGAVATRQGKFQAAIGGTLFLDEIGEMPVQLQVKLLRALQEKIVYKVGDTRAESVDIRVVAATNKILEEEVKKNTFREDLYYRLNVVTLKLPPLRERGEDLVVLGKYFLQKCAKEFGSKAKGFTPAAAIAMRKYSWPGNIRELENRIKKAVVLADKALLAPDDLDLLPENLDPIMPLSQAKEEFQKRYINEVLERNNGNRTKTAKDLGVDPRTVFRHLEKLEAERSGRTLPRDESDEELEQD
ncbi:MAG TPA: sigma 54-interacting transcriptional regulator [Myxococcaceae bacterium]|nr:sigma 54-interacting transcriptional regulator [Myxococcaceae bacterium]